MCGRALPDDVSKIKLDLKIEFDEIADYKPSFNAAPTAKLPVVVAKNGARALTQMRWGLVPSWATDLKIGYSTFNARAERIESRAAFRAAWRAGRRCLVVADGYYEWRDADKQPFAVALGNRGPMLFAGLWDVWRAPDGTALKSFAIVTTAANALLQPLHGRMPAVLPQDSWAAWLGETAASDAALKALLKPYPGERMTFWPVDRRVGNVRNDDPDLFAPRAERSDSGMFTASHKAAARRAERILGVAPRRRTTSCCAAGDRLRPPYPGERSAFRPCPIPQQPPFTSPR